MRARAFALCFLLAGVVWNLTRELGLDEARVVRWAWALAVDRLLQIADSTHAGHARLCESLRGFIAEAAGAAR